MIIDSKQPPNGKTAASNVSFHTHSIHHETQTKLSIELPTPKPIYTTGSLLSGIIRSHRKNPESVQEIKVSLVCCVRSVFYRYYGPNVQDYRRENTLLFHRDQTLWSRSSADEIPPTDLPFEFHIPDSGIDSRANENTAFLPPSFHAGKHTGLGNMFTYGTRIGYIKYYVKARLVRKGFLKLDETTTAPFVFLPPSGPPPVLPVPPETLSDQELDRLKPLWIDDTISTNIRHAIFSSRGRAILSLWLPRVEKLPRQTNIPFFLCLLLQTTPSQSRERPSDASLPSPTQLDKASIYLQQKTRVCARKGVQNHTKTYDKELTDNFVYSITPRESEWKCLTSPSGNAFWEKGYIWRGLWKFKETPNFTNRQLTVKYFLVAKIPMKGLGNDIALTSRELDINTGLLAGGTAATAELELLPEYFEAEAGSEDEQDEKN